MVKIHYIGHSAFALEGSKRILFDPWLTGNPKATWSLEDALSFKPDYVFISHGHGDHGFSDAVEITKKRGKAIGVFELIQALQQRGGSGIGANIGGTLKLEGVKAYVTPALHSCPYATPAGYIVEMDGVTLYHAGDTALTKEMELLGEVFEIDVALLPIGGHFTMSYKEVEKAKEMLKAKRYIGMHYNTFPPITINVEEAKKYIEVYEPGTTIEL